MSQKEGAYKWECALSFRFANRKRKRDGNQCKYRHPVAVPHFKKDDGISRDQAIARSRSAITSSVYELESVLDDMDDDYELYSVEDGKVSLCYFGL